MNKELVDKWVAALRSGEYKQTESVLFDGTGYCCLGVLCKVVQDPIFHEDKKRYQWFDATAVVPVQIKEMVGLNSNVGEYTPPNNSSSNNSLRMSESLVHLNDRKRLTFNEIADIIESRPEGLFVEDKDDDH